MRAGVFAYPWDFNEAALERQLTQLREIGFGRLVLAVLYHDGRQLLPQAAPGRIAWIEGGRSYVPVRTDRYPAGLAPVVAAGGLDAASIREAAVAAGLEVAAWTVTLHRDDLLRTATADLPRIESAFGDVHQCALCPAAPDSRAYFSGHLEDIADAGFSTAVLEAAHYPPLLHGAHHESSFGVLETEAQWLLSLCFCRHCQAAAVERGIDTERLRSGVAKALTAALEGDPGAVRAIAASDELEAFAALRCRLVAALLEGHGGRLATEFADQGVIAGAVFRTGRPDPAAPSARQLGVDYRLVAAAAERLIALAYFHDPDAAERHVRGYLDDGIGVEQLGVALRPFPPDVTEAGSLLDKLTRIGELGVASVDFYNLGFARALDLRSIATALAGQPA